MRKKVLRYIYRRVRKAGSECSVRLLQSIRVVLVACVCMSSCVDDRYPEDLAMADGTVSLTFDMRVLGFGATRAGDEYLPAERISTLRVVIVDLGINCDGEEEAAPQVEYNRVMNNVSVSGKDGVVSLKFPKIRAGRQKKVYLLINSEQSYLDLKWDGKEGTDEDLKDLDKAKPYLPGTGGKVPIEDATFVSPQGSYLKNNIPSDNIPSNEKEELLVPMTAFHSFSIPDIKTLENLYPLQANMAYAVPGELYVVRAINKITFEFVNNTYSNGFEGLDLLIREWSISKINDRAYLFGHPDGNGDLFNDTTDSGDEVNAPWMLWLKKQAEESQLPQSGDYKPLWLTEYFMPNGESGTYSFRPGIYEGKAWEGTPQDSDGYVLSAPDENTVTSTISTENDPVYFGESYSAYFDKSYSAYFDKSDSDAKTQQYELAFTVWQRTEEDGGSWKNPYTYRAVSTVDDSNFNIQSLFRSTHLVMKVTFHSGMGRPDFEIDVHPYGSYELDPVFGL